MKVDRHGPRCRTHANHVVATPATDDEALRDLPLHRRLADSIGRRAWIRGAPCAHAGWSHPSRAERDWPPARPANPTR